MSEHGTDQSRLNRRGFLQSTAVAAGGLAAVAAPVAAVKALEAPGAHPAAVVTHPSGPMPAEPVLAYLRDAKTSEVTVLSGTTETTYKDPVLAQRLQGLVGPEINGGGI